MMKCKSFSISAVFVILVLLISCKTSEYPSQILVKYQKKPYEQKWNSDILNIKGQLMPPDAMTALKVLQEYGDTIQKNAFDSILINEQKGLLSIRLRIEPSEKIKDTLYAHNTDVVYGFNQSADERSTSIEQYNYGMSNSIWLLINGKKIFPALYHTEQVFGLENGRNIWLSFKVSKEEIDKASVINCCTLFIQLSSPLRCVAQLEWPSSVIKKCI